MTAAPDDAREPTREGLTTVDNVAERLAELGLSMSPAMLRTLDVAMDAQAFRIAAADENISRQVTRTTALVGAMSVDDHLRDIGSAAGLDWESFRQDAELTGWSAPSELTPLGDAPFHERALGALELYARVLGDERPMIDPVGLSWALISVEPGRFHERLIEAGAVPDELASRLWKALQQEPPPPFEQTSSAPILQRGDQGSEVRWLQLVLARLGHDPGGLDGSFGPATSEAVGQFQQDNQLAVDRIVGPVTLSELERRAARPVTGGLRPDQLGVAFVQQRPVVAVLGDDSRPVLVDLDRRSTQPIDPMEQTPATALAVPRGSGAPLVLTAWNDGTVRATDLGSGDQHDAFSLPTKDITALSAAQVDGRLLVAAIRATDPSNRSAGATWLVGSDVEPQRRQDPRIDPQVFWDADRWVEAWIDPSSHLVRRADAATGEELGAAFGGADVDFQELRLGGPPGGPILVTRSPIGLVERHSALDGTPASGVVGPDGDDTRRFAAGEHTIALATTTGMVRRFDLVSADEIGDPVVIPVDELVSLDIAESDGRVAIAAIDSAGTLWSWTGLRANDTPPPVQQKRPRRQKPPAEDPPDEVPRQGFSRRARSGLQYAARLARSVDGGQVDSIAILAGLVLAAPADDRPDAPRAVWDFMSREANSDDPIEVLRLVSQFGVAEIPETGARVSPPNGFDDDGRSVLVAARRLGNDLSQRDRVAARHLLAAMLEPSDLAPRVQSWLAEQLDLDALRTHLFDAQDGFLSAGDDISAWRRVLGLEARDVAPGFDPPTGGYSERAADALAYASRLGEAAGMAVDPRRIFAGLMLQARHDPADEPTSPRSVWNRISAARESTDPVEALGFASELGVDAAPPEPGKFRPPPVGMDEDATIIMARARQHALAISSDDTINARHLMAAVLSPDQASESVAIYLEDAVGIDVTTLRLGLYNDMAAGGFGDDDDEEWRARLGLLDETDEGGELLGRRPRAGYDGDYVLLGARQERGQLQDHLSIDTDVEALSRVAMANDIDPPMSIGLFGDWGSGKTYFMGLMDQEVEKLEAVAKRAHEDRTRTVYCRDVAQIHFNVWHFVDTNLWASIVTHIFGRLADHFNRDGATPNVWDKALRQTKRAGAQLKAAGAAVLDAEKDVNDATREVTELGERVTEINTKIAERAKTIPRVRDYLATAFGDKRITSEVEEAATELGVPEARESVEALEAEVKRAKTLSGRSRAVWHSLGGHNAGLAAKASLASVAAAIAVVPALIVWLVSTELGDAARLVVSATTGVLGVAFDRVVTLRPAIDAAERGLARLENVHEAVVAQATFELRAELDELIEVRTVAMEQLAEATRDLERAQADHRDAAQRVDHVRSGAFIAEFIREQSEKPDYKDRLGIINEIRLDFEGLSSLLRDASDDDPDIRRLDRIILYIDDLDRCPTERVVDVLQAIHLLLTFELFVVVVGVDSRWLLHALEEQYSAFGAVDGPTTIERLRWRTTPQNYLEKIFQIPFTLRPMGSTGFAQLIGHLTEQKVESETETPKADTESGGKIVDTTTEHDAVSAAVGTESGGETVSAATVAAETAGGADTVGAGSKTREVPAEPSSEGDTGVDPEGTAGVDENVAVEPVPPPETPIDDEEIDAAPPELDLTNHERMLMGRLDELVPTPRATKRFVNLYRLIKATIRSTSHLKAFVGTEQRPGHYQAVMLMLAMQAGFPTQSYEVFRHLGERPTGSWWLFVDGLSPARDDGAATWEIPSLSLPGLGEGEAEIWRELHQALSAQRRVVRMVDTLDPFVRYATDVARFGFVTGRAVAPERADRLRAAVEPTAGTNGTVR